MGEGNWRGVSSVYWEVMGRSGLEAWLGPRPDRPPSSSRVVLAWKTFHVSMLVVIVAYTSSQTCCLVVSVERKMDDGLMNVAITLSCFESMLKCAYFIWRVERLRELCRLDEVAPEVRSTERWACGLARIVHWMARAIVLSWMIMPLMSRSILPSCYCSRPSPLLTLIFETLALFSGLICHVPVDLFFMTASFMISAQLKHLATKLHPDVDIAEFARRHNLLLRMCRRLRELWSPVLGLQLTCCVVSLCTLTFAIVTESWVQDGYVFHRAGQMRYFTYYAVVILQLLGYCMAADQVTEANKFMAFSAYGSGWWLQPATFRPSNSHNYRQGRDDYRRNMLIVLTMSQHAQAASFTALKMVKIDLTTFIDVLRLSYSYYTFLRGFTGK